MNTYVAVAHATGKYHHALGPHATLCSASGQRRSPSTRPATSREVREASAERFCKHCFRNERAIQMAKSEAAE